MARNQIRLLKCMEYILARSDLTPKVHAYTLARNQIQLLKCMDYKFFKNKISLLKCMEYIWPEIRFDS